MTAIFITAGVAAMIVLAEYGLKYKRKYERKSEEYERLELRFNHYDSFFNEKTKLYTRKVNEMRTALLRGHENLILREYTSHIEVAGASPNDKDVFFIIKIFPFVKDDEDDREFAIRQGEELIETIKNA